MPQGLTQDQAKREFAKHGFVLKEHYHTIHIPCLCVCSCGTLVNKTLHSLRRGETCKQCGLEKMRKTKTHLQQDVANYFKQQNCELLDLYSNSNQKVRYRCICGQIAYITYNNFQRGQRCSLCGRQKTSRAQAGAKHWNWNPDRTRVEMNAEATKRFSKMLSSCLHRVQQLKDQKTEKLLGYTAQDLETHLASFTNYEYLVVTKTLAIDHILPVKAFIDHGISDPKIICALDNLQPLSRAENCEKNDFYVEEQFLEYCFQHNITCQRKVA